MKPYFLICTTWVILFWGLLSNTITAQFSGNIAYQDYEYAYDLKEVKPKGNYRLLVQTVPPQPNNTPVYQSVIKIAGGVASNEKLTVTIWRASVENGKWVVNRESTLETTFDYQQKKVSRTLKGSFAQFRTQEYTEVVADNITPQTVDEATAIRYVMEDLLVNYNRILAAHTSTDTKSESVKPASEEKLSIAPQLAVFPASFNVTKDNINYKVIVGGIDATNRRQEFQVKVIEQNTDEDAGSTSTLFSSYLIIDDKVGNNNTGWAVRIHFAEKTNSFTWRPYPSQFLECKLNVTRKEMTYTPGARLVPFQENQPPKAEAIAGNNGQITKDELLNIAVTHFIRHYSKIFGK